MSAVRGIELPNLLLVLHTGKLVDWWVSAGSVLQKSLAVSISNFRFHHSSHAPGTSPTPPPLGALASYFPLQETSAGEARLGQEVTGGRWPVPSPRSCNLRHV